MRLSREPRASLRAARGEDPLGGRSLECCSEPTLGPGDGYLFVALGRALGPKGTQGAMEMVRKGCRMERCVVAPHHLQHASYRRGPRADMAVHRGSAVGTRSSKTMQSRRLETKLLGRSQQQTSTDGPLGLDGIILHRPCAKTAQSGRGHAPTGRPLDGVSA